MPAALTAWADGERRVVLLRSQPSPREMLRLQARGWRCVSLLPEGSDTGRHADVVDFAIHDLCHLEKFAAPEHHRAQVGFFALLDLTTSSLNSPRPWSWELNRHRVGDAFFGANFGTIEVDWSAADPLVTLAIRDDRGEVAFFHRVPLGTLAASAPPRTP